jgi:hypothetical protein
MSGRLRRRYQRLLVTYPPAYRRAHGEEILGTLLEAARPDQQLPAPREAASLLLGGLRTRAHQAATQSPRRLWADGLHLGVLLIVLVNLGHALQPPSPFPLWIALVAVTALAVLRGWTRTALVAATITALAAARPLLPQVALPWWLPGYGDWSVVARYAVPAAVLALLAWPGVGRPRAWSWWWLLWPAAAMLPLGGTHGPWPRPPWRSGCSWSCWWSRSLRSTLVPRSGPPCTWSPAWSTPLRKPSPPARPAP